MSGGGFHQERGVAAVDERTVWLTGIAGRGYRPLSGKPIVAFWCCMVLAGCETTNPFERQFRFSNPFGSPFADRQDVLNHIPIGTRLEKAQAVMEAHGFQQSCSQQQDRDRTVIFRPCDLARSRRSCQDITLFFKDEAVVDVNFHAAPTIPAAPG